MTKRNIKYLQSVLVMEKKQYQCTNKAGKYAQNLKFENTWMKVIQDIEVENWQWDTMLASHVLDNRPGITGLKIQTYLNFGVKGYEEDVSEYLKADSKNSNSVNGLENAMKSNNIRQKFIRC